MAVRDTSIDPKLLESAKCEFLKCGFLKADLKAICENAGVTTGAVYKRYKGKEELFCAVVQGAIDQLDAFMQVRADIDFSHMSDAELRKLWIMREKDTIDLFKMLWNVKDEFQLLLDKSAGTIYENFRHDVAEAMTQETYLYYLETRKRGMTDTDVSKEEIHVLCSSYWTSIYEPFIHGMSRKKMEEHCKIICLFFDWKKALKIK